MIGSDFNENEDDIIDEWTNTAIDEYSRNVKFKDGAREFLNLLREKGKKIAVATATMPELCFSALKNHGLENFFDNITFITEVGRGKGFPDVYLKAAEKLGISPDECAVFEDIPAGIAGAKLGGFYTVGVYEKTSEHLSDIMKSTSDKFIYSFRDILV